MAINKLEIDGHFIKVTADIQDRDTYLEYLQEQIDDPLYNFSFSYGGISYINCRISCCEAFHNEKIVIVTINGDKV